MTQGGGDLLQKVSERHEQRLFLVRWHLRLNLAAYQVYYCNVAGHGLPRRRSAGVMLQVTTCCVAGHGVQRGRSAFLCRTCNAICLTAAISVAGPQQRIGPATPGWQTCDAVCFPAVLALPVPSLPRPTPRLPAPRSRTPCPRPPSLPLFLPPPAPPEALPKPYAIL